MSLPQLLSLVAIAVLAWWVLRRANELFALRLRDTRLVVLRGRVPAALVADFRDVLRDVRHAELRAVLDGGRPALRVRGELSVEHVQRLRNVLGRFTVSQIRTAPRRLRG